MKSEITRTDPYTVVVMNSLRRVHPAPINLLRIPRAFSRATTKSGMARAQGVAANWREELDRLIDPGKTDHSTAGAFSCSRHEAANASSNFFLTSSFNKSNYECTITSIPNQSKRSIREPDVWRSRCLHSLAVYHS